MADKKKKGAVYDPKKDYADRGELERKIFEPFKVDGHEPETLVFLLASKEDEVVVRTLHHLSKFAENHKENSAQLHKLNLIQKCLEYNLHQHALLHIRRFTLKIFAALTELENEYFDDHLIEELYSIANNNYVEAMDSFMIEYSAVIIFNLLREPRICANVESDVEFIRTLFKHVATTKDVDILHYSYKILVKLFHTTTSIFQLCDIDTYPFERVLGDITSQYPEIQEDALNVFTEVAACKSRYYETKFICPIFFEELFKVLENNVWIDRHPSVLAVLKRLMNNENFAKVFCRNEFLYRFINFVKNKTSYKLECIGVLAEISQFEEHLDNLFVMSVTTIFLEFLKNIILVNVDVCKGIQRMLRNSESFKKIVDDDPIWDLLNIIKSDLKDWDIRNAAAITLRDLLKRSHKCCESAVESDLGKVFATIFQYTFGQATSDFLLNLINTLIIMAKDQQIRNELMEGELPKALAKAFKINMRSAILTTNFINCATAFISEKNLEEEFLSSDMINAINIGLKTPALIVKNAVADFIVVTGKNLKFAEEYIDGGILEYLLDEDKAITSCPSWSPAIESILSTNLSFKFLIRGRLEITDLTGDDFVVSKYYWRDFKILRKLQLEEVSPLYPIILVNYNLPCADSMQNFKFECRAHEFFQEGEFHDSKSMDSEKVSTCLYCRRPADTRLPKYLDQLRQELETRGLVDNSKVPNCIDITKIAERAKVVAEIVHKQMCGAPSLESDCPYTDVAVLNHLNEVKCQLHCNIIPVGQIRYGAHFERAILFKTLADQIGLPATLVRGIDGRILYNEIPIPEQAEQPGCNLTILPMRLLYPTHLVDLLDYPGQLYPLESRKAYRYLRLL